MSFEYGIALTITFIFICLAYIFGRLLIIKEEINYDFEDVKRKCDHNYNKNVLYTDYKVMLIHKALKEQLTYLSTIQSSLDTMAEIIESKLTEEEDYYSINELIQEIDESVDTYTDRLADIIDNSID